MARDQRDVPSCLVFRARGQQMVRADGAGTKTPVQKSRLLLCKVATEVDDVRAGRRHAKWWEAAVAARCRTDATLMVLSGCFARAPGAAGLGPDKKFLLTDSLFPGLYCC